MCLWNLNYLMVELNLTKWEMMECTQDTSQGRLCNVHTKHYYYYRLFGRFAQDDRYSLKCQVEGTSQTNINQGFIDAKREKGLPSKPSAANPVTMMNIDLLNLLDLDLLR